MVETGRVDALPCGLFTTGISLLALEIRAGAVGQMWVGIVRRVDRPLLYLNLASLRTVTVLPRPTAMLATAR